ncbi:hypothetical protein K1719_025828 [Acacia pycnantha]|nr:hypothetical protein K1719_025828 [Acacia pycnantha]
MNQRRELKDDDEDEEERCDEILNKKATNRILKEPESFSNLILFFSVRKISAMTAMAAYVIMIESGQLEPLLNHAGDDADRNKQQIPSGCGAYLS